MYAIFDHVYRQDENLERKFSIKIVFKLFRVKIIQTWSVLNLYNNASFSSQNKKQQQKTDHLKRLSVS